MLAVELRREQASEKLAEFDYTFTDEPAGPFGMKYEFQVWLESPNRDRMIKVILRGLSSNDFAYVWSAVRQWRREFGYAGWQMADMPTHEVSAEPV